MIFLVVVSEMDDRFRTIRDVRIIWAGIVILRTATFHAGEFGYAEKLEREIEVTAMISNGIYRLSMITRKAGTRVQTWSPETVNFAQIMGASKNEGRRTTMSRVWDGPGALKGLESLWCLVWFLQLPGLLWKLLRGLLTIPSGDGRRVESGGAW